MRNIEIWKRIVMDEIEKIASNNVRLTKLHAKNNTGMDNAVIKNNEKLKKNKESIFIDKEKNEDENLQISIPKTSEELNNTVKTAAVSEKLKEYDIDTNKPFVITEELKAKFRAKGKVGFKESIKSSIAPRKSSDSNFAFPLSH